MRAQYSVVAGTMTAKGWEANSHDNIKGQYYRTFSALANTFSVDQTIDWYIGHRTRIFELQLVSKIDQLEEKVENDLSMDNDDASSVVMSIEDT